MKKIIFILFSIFTLTSCGPHRLRCGPNRRCEIKNQMNLNHEKNSITVTNSSFV
ncbi:lipoprotein [Flavobacterium sp. H122]|uniref:lipoprotein n=1 Tax=Flavobacterium sp. H122 TaxID=2529860 RepID=UPI00145B251B